MDFQPLFDHLDDRFDSFREEFTAEFRSLRTDIANLAAEVHTIREEMAIANHRVKRLEDWAEPVGNKVGIPIKL